MIKIKKFKIINKIFKIYQKLIKNKDQFFNIYNNKTKIYKTS